jgi:hypothetical protein
MLAAITWQPIPASAIEPSGTRVEVLCGQPEQYQAGRGGVSTARRSTASLASRNTSLALIESHWWKREMRCAITRAICAIEKSALGGSSHSPRGCTHSPCSENLPITRGRTSSRQL